MDLDDTLVAFDLVTESTWRQVCDEYCTQGTSIKSAELYEAVTKESKWYWSDEERHRIGRNDIVSARRGIVKTAFEKYGFPVADATRVADRYSELRLLNMYLLPGVEETLHSIKGRNIPIAMISNGDSPIQRAKLARFDLEKYFDMILIEGEVGFGKPDRRIYELALSRLGTLPSETVMVGDNMNWDVIGPMSVGMRGIWFDVKGKGLPPESEVRPDAVITEVAQLLDHLD